MKTDRDAPVLSSVRTPPTHDCSKSEYRALALLVGVYVLVFFALAWRKYAVFGSDSGDLSAFVWMLQETFRGNFFPHPIGGSNFGYHPVFLWIPTAGIFWLIPTVPTLLFLQTLLLGLAAIPVYLLARHLRTGHCVALVLAAAFLLFPPIVSANLNQIQEPPLYTVYLLCAFYFFARERFGWFMLFAAIACLGRETVSVAIAMFGMVALVSRRKWRWVIGPIVMGGGYFGLLIWVVMPYFRHGLTWHAFKMGYFSYLGDNPRAIVFHALSDPALVMRHVFSKEIVTYLFMLLQPLGLVLPFLSPVWLVGLLDLMTNILTDNGALRVIAWHYNMTTGCSLFVGAVYGVGKVGRWLRHRYGGQPTIVIATALLVLSIAHWFIWFNPQQYRRLPEHETLLRAIAIVPPHKSLSAPIRLLGSVAINRDHYVCNTDLFNVKPDCAAQYEYVILDANERQYAPIITEEFFNRFARNSKYQLIFAEDNVFVFQRLGGESDWKVPLL